MDTLTDLQWQTAMDKEAVVGIGVAGVNEALFVSLMVGVACTDSQDNEVAKDLKQTALRALGTALCADAGLAGGGRALRWNSELPVGALDGESHGFVAVRCSFDQAEFVLVLCPPLTVAYLPTRTGRRKLKDLTSLRGAVASQPVVLDVHAGDSELTLPELASLAAGDVIRLDRRLDEPALVRLGGVAAFCTGHLGTRGEKRAVQLAFLSDRNEV